VARIRYLSGMEISMADTAEPKTAGCFTYALLSAGRWRITNGHTGFSYVTYGTEVEVRDELLRQTRSWEARLSGTKRRSAFNAMSKNKASV
jgi:hypothetical protein